MFKRKTSVNPKTIRNAGVLGSPPTAPIIDITYCKIAEVNLAEINLHRWSNYNSIGQIFVCAMKPYFPEAEARVKALAD